MCCQRVIQKFRLHPWCKAALSHIVHSTHSASRVFFLTSLLNPHRDVYVYVDGVNDDDDDDDDCHDLANTEAYRLAMMCCFWPLWWVHTLELCDPWQQKPNARVTVAKLKLIKQNKTFQRQKLRLKKHFKNKHKKIKESSAWAEIRLTFLFNCEYD